MKLVLKSVVAEGWAYEWPITLNQPFTKLSWFFFFFGFFDDPSLQVSGCMLDFTNFDACSGVAFPF